MLNTNNNSNGIDPTIILKLMNLLGQLKSTGKRDNQEDDDQENNTPVKSEPYDYEYDEE